jgi:hypothetical protein
MESTIERYFTTTNLDFDLDWQNFIIAISKRNLRPRPYILDTAKHLFAISQGAMPGFQVAESDNISAPITILQDIYANIYELKNYLPTLMLPYGPTKNTNSSIYYSLSFPSIFEKYSGEKLRGTDIISDMRALKDMFETVMVTDNRGTSPFRYEYFHTEQDIYQQIQPSSNIIKNDASFLTDEKNFPGRLFCPTAPFFSGCIKIK